MSGKPSTRISTSRVWLSLWLCGTPWHAAQLRPKPLYTTASHAAGILMLLLFFT